MSERAYTNLFREFVRLILFEGGEGNFYLATERF